MNGKENINKVPKLLHNFKRRAEEAQNVIWIFTKKKEPPFFFPFYETTDPDFFCKNPNLISDIVSPSSK